MKFSRALIKKFAVFAAGLLLLWLATLWLALPRLLHWQAEKIVAEKSGHRLELARPEFNPFTLSLRLTALKLSEPAGAPLLAFDELVVDLSAASLPRRALVLDGIRLDGLRLTLVELPEKRLNWTRLLESFKSDEPAPGSGMPRFDIARFDLLNGQVDFADRRSADGFATRIEPLELSLTDVSTLPDDNGKFSLVAKTADAAELRLEGQVDLNPLVVEGLISLQGLKLAQFAPFLKSVLPAPPAGVAGVSARYLVGNTGVGNSGAQLQARLEDLNLKISDLQVPLSADAKARVAADEIALQAAAFDWPQQTLTFDRLTASKPVLVLPDIERSLQLGGVAIEKVSVDLLKREARLAAAKVNQGQLEGVRTAGGDILVLKALQSLTLAPRENNKAKAARDAAQSAAADANAPWRFTLDTVEIADLDIRMRDEGVSPPAEIGIDKLALIVGNLTEDLAKPLPVKLAFDIAPGGRFESAGNYTPGTHQLELDLKLAELPLKPVQPYLAARTTLILQDGRLSSAGKFSYDERKGPGYRGDFALKSLRLDEAGTGKSLLAWKNLATNALTVTSQRLDIGELRLGGLDTRLLIDKEKNVNFNKLVRSPASPAAQPAPAPAPDADFLVNIERLRFYAGELFFADESLVLPFGTRIHGLRGSLSHLSSRPGGTHGQLELEGEVDEYGMARAVGQVDLFDPTGFMDIRVLFKNVEMTRLTPYVATFAGRKIESGKLSLDLQYKLNKRQMQGENQVLIDRLKLGERIESPTAKDLPLDLAIAILQDSSGRIDLGLPVAGSLDDPEFSYGAVVWKAITNVLTKIVTAPFRALASLFGGGEQIDAIAFEPGAHRLTPPEREKLVRLSGMLEKRAGLVLSVGGTYGDADRVALQEVQLRRAVLKRSGEPVREEYDPGSLSTAQPKVRKALEELYAERVGASDLAALKEGFRQANPGQLEEGVTGKMMSRLSGLLREKKTLSTAEVDQLKGADFYAVLFYRLRDGEVVSEERLRQLAQSRAESAIGILKTPGMAVERYVLLPVEKGEVVAGNIPLRLVLDAARKTE